jgi:hypothetical protein
MLDTSGRSLTTELHRCDEVNLRKYEEIIITLLAPGKRCTFTNLVPRAFPFLSLGSREKALAPGGLLCILIGQ